MTQARAYGAKRGNGGHAGTDIGFQHDGPASLSKTHRCVGCPGNGSVGQRDRQPDADCGEERHFPDLYKIEEIR